MAKAITIIAFLVLGGGLGGTCYWLAERVDDQETQIGRLRQELETLREQASAPAVAAERIDPAAFDFSSAGEPAAEIGIPDEELRELVGRLVADESAVGAIASRVEGRIEPTNTLLGTSAFKEGVRTTMDEIREEERQRQIAEREERMWERTEERARDIAARLNLPPQTAEELTQIILGSVQARQETMALMRDGEIPREDIRLTMRQQREETDLKIQSVLTPTEYAAYQKIEEEMGPGGRGGRGFDGAWFGPPPGEMTPAEGNRSAATPATVSPVGSTGGGTATGGGGG
jgi:hypothetical protein